MIDRYIQQKLIGDILYLKQYDIKPNFSALAKKYDLDRHTIAKYWEYGEKKMTLKQRTSIYDPYFDEIKDKIDSVESCTKMALFKYFQSKYGDQNFYCYSTFAHYLQRKELTKEVDLKIHLRYETPPGGQLQLDWKEDLKMILKSGEVIDFNLFVATFGYSRYHFYIYSKTKTTYDFLRCLITVLKMVNGVPEQMLTDNMSAVVSIKPDGRVKHQIIKQFEKDVGVSIRLCKVRTPETKGKVESANRFVNWIKPYSHELESESELINLINAFNKEVNKTVNQSIGIPPCALIKKEMEHLKPLPNNILLESYIQNVNIQTVPSTLLVYHKGSQYSVPPKFIGKRVRLIPIDDKLYIYFNTDLICVHEVSKSKINYRSEDYYEGLRSSYPAEIDDDDIMKRAQDNLALFAQYEGDR